jgi:hypothetical protein
MQFFLHTAANPCTSRELRDAGKRVPLRSSGQMDGTTTLD